jgi:hypothetical protein
MNLVVDPGEYMIRRGKRVIPYFSGKSTLVEITFDNFGYESGTKKEAGYFSSNTTAPYDSGIDGFKIESICLSAV